MNTENVMPNAAMNQPASNPGAVVDVMDLVHLLLSKIWVLILCLVLGAAAAGTATSLFLTPKYEASSMIYIYSKSTSITSLADIQLGSQLAVDFTIVATTREVMENVIEAQNLNMTYDQILECVSISNPQNSHILVITVTLPDPDLAAKISNGIAQELRSRIADVMNTDEPSMVERATVPTKPSSPNVLLNALIGGIGLAFVVAVGYVAVFLMDDTIKTDEDVKRYLNLNVLAQIPSERAMKKSGKSSKASKHAKAKAKARKA